ncbi:MAG: XRE family transcriptional regulator [Bacteroidales bacterium]|nr:XRE family transcriptional regulator [Bacteroidales bacterium]
MTTIERLRYLMGVMRMNQSEFAHRLGINPTTLSKYMSERITLTDALINKVVVNCGVSKRWLTSGDDVPFAKGEESSSLPEVTIAPMVPVRRVRQDTQGVPVYDIDVTAGCLELSRMFTEDRIEGYINLPDVSRDCVIVRVMGDSMAPAIRSGGRVAIRPIRNLHNIFWGRAYVVVMDDYRMIKYLRKHADPSKVILHSCNPAYDDMEVDRSEIRALFIVEAIIHCDLFS